MGSRYSEIVTPEVSYYYDLNRYPDPDNSGTVYDKGHMTEVQTASIGSVPLTSQAYNYDLVGRTIQHRQTVGSYVYSMSYSYNAGGALTSEIYPSGRVVSYAYDNAARLSQVSSGGTTYAGGFVFGTNGLLTSYNLGNGTAETFGYNSRLQLTSIDLAKGNTQLQHYDYKYGVYNPAPGAPAPDSVAVDETKNNGQIAQIDAKIGGQGQWTQKFEYDSLGRLSSARENYGVDNTRSYLVNYDYDLFGNRYQKQSRNTNNPFVQKWVEDGDVTQTTNRYASGITYDEAGNVTRDERFHNLKFAYDANDRQRKSSDVNDVNEVGAVIAVFDGTGQRVATMSGTNFINISVYDAASQLVAEYGQTSAGSGTQYIVSDHQGTPRVVTTSTGTVVSRHDYLPFGEDLGAGIGMRTGVGTGRQQYGASDGVRQKYAGMENDDATGMDHTLWRKYDSASGRWTTPDPYGGSMTIASPQSFNRYSYVNNDPVNKVDLLGLMLSDIGVYQTTNEAEVDLLNHRMLGEFRNNTRQKAAPHSGSDSGHGGGPGTESGSDHHHSDSSEPLEHNGSNSESPPSHSEETEQPLTEGQRKIVTDVVGTAVNFLKRFPDCAHYVGANSKDPAAELNGLQSTMTYFNGVDFSQEEKSAVAAARGNIYGRGTGHKHIVLGYYYFDKTTLEADSKFWGLSSVKMERVMVMLHEYKHYTENRGHVPGMAGDDSNAWNKNIIRLCIK